MWVVLWMWAVVACARFFADLSAWARGVRAGVQERHYLCACHTQTWELRKDYKGCSSKPRRGSSFTGSDSSLCAIYNSVIPVAS